MISYGPLDCSTGPGISDVLFGIGIMLIERLLVFLLGFGVFLRYDVR